MYDYILDNCLTSAFVMEHLNKSPINTIVDLDIILKRLKTFLHRYQVSNIFVIKGPIYEHIFPLPSGEYYKMCWNIEASKLIIKRANIKITSINVMELKTSIDKIKIEDQYLKNALTNEEPIILARIPMVNRSIVIDGAHRVLSRKSNNISFINGYIMEPEYHFFAMPSDSSRAIYISIETYKCISDFLVGDATRADLDKLLSNIDNFHNINSSKDSLYNFAVI